VTLGRLVVAWLAVVIWFAVATFATASVVVSSMPVPADGDYARARSRALRWRIIEAGLLTLIASLWFDSLGSGEWWLVFLLLGALAACPAWFRTGPAVPTGVLIANTVADVTRYVVAGALLAWRLS
jgi:hypothetical protein